MSDETKTPEGKGVRFDFRTLDRPWEADWPVKVSVPMDGGKVEVQTFDVRFRLLTEEENKAVDAVDVLDRARAQLRHALIGFGRDEATPWSETLREQLISTPYIRMALIKGYQEFLMGTPAKN